MVSTCMMSLKVECVTSSDILARHQSRNLRSQFFLKFLLYLSTSDTLYTRRGLWRWTGLGDTFPIFFMECFEFFASGSVVGAYIA